MGFWWDIQPIWNDICACVSLYLSLVQEHCGDVSREVSRATRNIYVLYPKRILYMNTWFMRWFCIERILNVSCMYPERILNISWAYPEHIQSVSWWTHFPGRISETYRPLTAVFSFFRPSNAAWFTDMGHGSKDMMSLRSILRLVYVQFMLWALVNVNFTFLMIRLCFHHISYLL